MTAADKFLDKLMADFDHVPDELAGKEGDHAPARLADWPWNIYPEHFEFFRRNKNPKGGGSIDHVALLKHLPKAKLEVLEFYLSYRGEKWSLKWVREAIADYPVPKQKKNGKKNTTAKA